MPERKVYKIREMLREKVRLCVSGSKRTRNDKKGLWYEVIWYSNGDYELHKLNPCGIAQHSGNSHIPFNPMVHESFNMGGWGDDHEHFDDNNFNLEEEI